MTWALHLGRSAFAISLGILLGAGAALIGIEVAAHDREGDAIVEAAPATAPAVEPPTIIDVSRSALTRSGGSLALVALLGVAPGDPVTAVGGAPATHGFDDLAAAWDRAVPGDFIDVELARGRRALVLVHP